MIIGLFLRHYKIYNNVNFIPVAHSTDSGLSLFVGNNGVGKSSILEALNTFFNNGYWNKSKKEKNDQTFLCPCVLINKDEFNFFCKNNEVDKNVLEEISNYLFTYEDKNQSELKEFFKLRKNFELKKSDFYLLLVGSLFTDKNKAYFGSTFDNDIKKIIKTIDQNYNSDQILLNIKKYYNYIYIPVEANSNDFLKLETAEMQKLMNKDILETIDSILTEKINTTNQGRQKSSNLVSFINTTLNGFMDNINEKIRVIDDEYSFKVEDGYKKNLTAADLRDQILRAYFSIRTLKKNSKEIFELSSGEQRIALIDIATAFIQNNTDKQRCTILAIDEPEASLHISKCFNQFRRIENLSHNENTQVLLTTHWYGSLPTLYHGTLNLIKSGSKVEISSFPLNNYLEQRRDFPDDIDLKSFFELVSTIISSIKSENTKWLIIEGSDDHLYYKKYLDKKVENLFILPVGGCGNVIKIYEYLFAPFSEKTEKGILKDAKVLCLIDSDISQKNTKFTDKKIEHNLKLCRIQNFNHEISLCGVNAAGNYVPTAIEDCLNPSIFFKALEKSFEEENFKEYQMIFQSFEFNTTFNSSRLTGEKCLLKPKTMEAFDSKDELMKIIQSNEFKIVLAQNYCHLVEEGLLVEEDLPDLFKTVLEFFNKKAP
ncbi:AAA family ATPase [Acinetobacter pragensis]|uniref:AAA family ATPase n=1 Tax=Acinetobacter pragensis TaxID=1806892 RepID=UPI00333FC299